MDLRAKLTREIEKQQEKITQLRTTLAAQEAYLQAQQDMLKLLPRDSTRDGSFALRPNSVLAKTRDIIREAGKPIHISVILEKLGKPVTKDSRSSLSGSIGWYVRRNEIFTRPLPNTFGLIEFANGSDEEPPENFGLEETKAEK